MFSKLWFRLLLPTILISFLISSCGATPPSGTFVWIDVPLDGLSFPEVQMVNIEGHATGSEGVARVEVWINGDLWTTIENPPTAGTLASFQSEWVPSSPGDYTIHAVAFGEDGTESQFDEVNISFGDETPAEVITVTPVPDEQVTLPEPAEATIQFWADPETIEAGGCTTIRWQAENVKQVIFGGVEQPPEGSYQDCLCENQSYTLTVVQMDETEEKRKVDIIVTGSCVTPEPVDTTPPPAPAQAVPANGLSIGCTSSQNLVWIPVSDESGIAEYQAKVQRHSGDNNWQDISGSVFSGIPGKQKSISVECGWYYRWRVRAVDGVGNVGSWSGWWEFVINLE